MSPLRLFRPFLAVGIIITLLISWLTLVVGPWSSGAFQRQLFRIFQSRATTGVKERTFSATFSQFVIYVDELSASQVRLKGLLVSDERNPEQSRIIVAREGRLLSDEATVASPCASWTAPSASRTWATAGASARPTSASTT